MASKVALIAGIGGMCGSNMARLLATTGGWEIISACRGQRRSLGRPGLECGISAPIRSTRSPRSRPICSTSTCSNSDTVFRRRWDNLISTIKANRFGFTEMMDSEAMMRRIFREFRAQRVIP